MYKCHACGRQFQAGRRISDKELWEEYIGGKRTYSELASEHGSSVSAVKRRLDKSSPVFHPYSPQESVVVMDTTYFGRDWGVMVFQDARSGRILNRKFVRYETNSLYLEGLEEIRNAGTVVKAVVCDGHKGLLESIDWCPVQMCQFHMLQIVRRKLTRNPHMLSARELLLMCMRMTTMQREDFETEFREWKARWERFLKERSLHKSGKRVYTHRWLRSAMNSIEYYLKHLFVCTDHPTLGIPHTTNRLEGINSELKRRLASHNGLVEKRRKAFIDGFLETWENNPDK